MNLLIITLILLVVLIVLVVVFCFLKDSFNNITKNQNELKDSFNNITKNQNELKDLPIFIINLRHRTDRKENMINLLDKLNLKNYEFIVPLSKEDSEKQMKKFNYNHMSVEQYSLLKTVMNIHLDMLKRNIKEYIISEDDLELNYNDIDYNYINNRYKKIKNDYDYDMFFLNFCHSKRKKRSNNLYKIISCLCAGFTIFNNSNNKLSNILLREHLMYKRHLDYLYRYIIKKHKLKIYGSKIFKQNTTKFGTDITGSRKSNKPW